MKSKKPVDIETQLDNLLRAYRKMVLLDQDNTAQLVKNHKHALQAFLALLEANK